MCLALALANCFVLCKLLLDTRYFSVINLGKFCAKNTFSFISVLDFSVASFLFFKNKNKKIPVNIYCKLGSCIQMQEILLNYSIICCTVLLGSQYGNLKILEKEGKSAASAKAH